MGLSTTYVQTANYASAKKNHVAPMVVIAVVLATLVILAGFSSILNGDTQGGLDAQGNRFELSPVAPIINSSAGSIGRTFAWTFEDNYYTWDISVDYNKYIQYRNDGTQRYMTLGQMDLAKSFVTPTDIYITAMAKTLDNSADDSSLSQVEEIDFILAFVQNITYSTDIDSTGRQEYYRFPLETLCDQTGDCEDKSFLFASITEALGYPSAIIVYDDHVGVGVSCSEAYGQYYEEGGTRYFYCETTDSGWQIGELPSDLDRGYVVPLD